MARRRGEDRAVEVRSEDGRNTLTGYAAVFHREGEEGTEYRLDGVGRVVERIAPEAFERALKEEHDVRALFNHESDNLLGRSSAGTLRLSVDDIGLRYDIDLPDTQVGRDVLEYVRRGDLNGSSFAFRPLDEEARSEGDKTVYVVRDLQLIDVGPVVFPAYKATEASLRSDDRFVNRPPAEVDARMAKLDALEQTRVQ